MANSAEGFKSGLSFKNGVFRQPGISLEILPGNENMPEVAVRTRPVILVWLDTTFRATPAAAA
jgi:hypothetical protein